MSAARPLLSSGETRRNLLQNYLSLLMGTGASKVLTFIGFLVLSGYFSGEPGSLGKYTLVFSLLALLNTLVDLGANQILGRNLVRELGNPRPSIEAMIYIRLLACLLVFPLAYGVSGWLGLDPPLAGLVLMGAFLSVEMAYDGYFSASMRLDLAAKSRFYSSLISVLLILLAIWLKLPLFWIIFIGVANPVIKFAFDRAYTQPFQWRLNPPDWARVRQMARDGLPLWIMGINYIIFVRVDTVMLVALSPTGYVDLDSYSVAFRFSEAFALLIGALAPSLMPLFVHAMANKQKMSALTQTVIRFLSVVLLVMTLLVFWYGPALIQLIYKNAYPMSDECLQVLIWSQMMVAINIVCYQILMVYNMQGKRLVLLVNILSSLVNIALNFWLIPTYQAVGASVATVLTEGLLVMAMLHFVARYTGNRLGSGVVTLLGYALCASILPFLLGAAWGLASVVIFIALVFGTRVLTLDQLRQLANERLHEAPRHPRSADIPDDPQR